MDKQRFTSNPTAQAHELIPELEWSIVALQKRGWLYAGILASLGIDFGRMYAIAQYTMEEG